LVRLRIGFIGAGIMGRPMAGHLLAAGYPLTVYSRTAAKSESLIDQGARWCDTPADAARDCDFLITVVTDTPDVEQVLFGPDGAAKTLARRRRASST
jgi:3-hydroxyisobutyrate dehydrogenase-like beta-hydroxyacid dehydrogenase